MIVLKQNQEYFKIVGLFLDDDQHSNWNNIFINIMASFPILGVLVLSIGYFIENISDLAKTTDATYVICALSLFFVHFWVFALQKIEFRMLIQELQSIIDKSWFLVEFGGCSHLTLICIFSTGINENIETYTFFNNVCKNSDNSTKKMAIILMACVGACMALPFVIVGITLILGTYTHDVWYLPYKV